MILYGLNGFTLKAIPLYASEKPQKATAKVPFLLISLLLTRKIKIPQHAEKNQRKREGALEAHRHPPVLDVILHIKVVDQKWFAQLGISNCLIQGES